MDNPRYTGAPNNNGLIFLNADGTNLKDLITGAVNGTKVSTIILVNEQAAVNQLIELWWNDGVNDFLITTTVIPQGAGTDGSPPVALLEGAEGVEVDNNGNFFFTLSEGEKFKIKMQAVIAGGEAVYATVFAQDF